MAEALEKNSLHTIIIKNRNAGWVEYGKEILISGHLFDVESYKITGEDLQLTGLYDTEEDSLNERLNKTEQEKSKENSGENRLLINILFQTLLTEKNTVLQNTILDIAIRSPQMLFVEKLYFTWLGIIKPPPKISLCLYS